MQFIRHCTLHPWSRGKEWSSLTGLGGRGAGDFGEAMSLIFDEFGRPFIILREQQAQSRIKGLEAQKVSIRRAPQGPTFAVRPGGG
jgi:hypothetical protein